MSAGVSRREFLKISSALLAGAGMGSAALSSCSSPSGRGKENAKGLRTVPTYCDLCFWKCGALATVRDGRIWKVEGNPLDPLSRGRLCPRGTAGASSLQDPDRLTRPLMRAKVRGEEKWNAVSWDEALGFVAEKMSTIKKKHGPEAVALFSHGIGGTFFKHTVKAFGSPNVAAPSFAQCRGPRDVGFRLTFGEDPGSPERTDIANARCLVLIGSHLGENMHNTQVQEFAEAVGRGCTVICADPRFSTAASKAKWWLPVKPGSDTALILAWLHVIVTGKLHDADYVARFGHGFDAFAASLKDWTPEWAYRHTGIKPEVIRQTAEEMARHRPATLVHPGRHTNWYGSDAQRSRAIALLNAVLGSWGRKGGFYVPSQMDLPAYPVPAYPKPSLPKVDNPGKKYPFAHETLTTGIRDATITGSPYPIKGWLVYATNLIHALPNEKETIEAIRSLDLLAVCDVIPSEIVGWADVVLPESNFLERHDEINAELFREPFLALRQPVVASPDDQKPNWWIARSLAQKLDLGAYYPWNDIEEYLGKRMELGGYDLAKLKREGILLGEKHPTTFEAGAAPDFPTPSGKIEFYSEQLASHGFDPVPRFEPPTPAPAGTFRVLSGRAPMHSFSRTQSNPLLHELMSENVLWVNATAARRLGLQEGDRVRMRNQDGVVSNDLAIRATERIRPDCVYLVHGFGHTAKGMRRARNKGASDAQIQSRYQIDPLMGGTALQNNFVSLEVI